MKKFMSKRVLTAALAAMMLFSVAAFSASAAGAPTTQTVFFYIDEDCLIPDPMGQDMVVPSLTTNDKGAVHLELQPESSTGYIIGLYPHDDDKTNLFVQYAGQDLGYGYAEYTADFIRDDGAAVFHAKLEVHGMPCTIGTYIKVDQTD
jgi:hypothetical protein